jgi:hypothetical protein
MTRAIAISLALLTVAVAPAAAPAATLRIANPGTLRAHAGGKVEFNGQTFSGGALRGRVSSAGRVSRGAASFGTATTDPAVDGPLQLTFHPVATGAVSGRFAVNNTPKRAADADGLVFGFRTRLYIAVGGPAVGPHCTIASAAAPLRASFGATLAGFFGTTDRGEAYNQSTGLTQQTAVFKLPGAQNCNGQEQTIDRQLGLPGPGSVGFNLAFTPVLQSTRYRARHPHHHRAVKHHHAAPAPTPSPQPTSGDTLAIIVAPTDGEAQLSVAITDKNPLMDELGLYVLNAGQPCPASHEAAVTAMNAGLAQPVIEATSVAQLIDTPAAGAVTTTISRYAAAPAPGQTVCAVLYLVTGTGSSQTLATAHA